MLTKEEKREAKRAKYFGIEWGVPGLVKDQGFSPEMWLAVYRGADFIIKDGAYVPETYLDAQRGHRAIEDISKWLGFKSIDDYFATIVKEKKDIFKRATKEKG